MINRRSFIERLGLGAGAALLSPIAQTLVSEAQGQVATRKRLVIFIFNQGMPWSGFTPKELEPGTEHKWTPSLDGTTAFTWPTMARPIEQLRSRTLWIDGLANRVPRSQHGGGCGALSGVTAANGSSNEYTGQPGATTIDQHIANQISSGTRLRSLLCGLGGSGLTVGPFATGRMQFEPVIQNARMMYDTAFAGAASGPGDAGRGVGRRKLTLDLVRADINRLSAALSAPEKRKLEHYLASLEDFEKRQSLALTASCTPPAVPPDKAATNTQNLDLMMDIATQALTCGVTNVVGVAPYAGQFFHNDPTFKDPVTGAKLSADGHTPIETQAAAMEGIHNLYLQFIARMVQGLSSIKEGDRTIFDNTTIIYTSDNGESHHSTKQRWPVLVIGNAGGKLRADGRFLRYPPASMAGRRSLADFYCSLSVAMGVPHEGFGKGGVEPVKGPLDEVLT